MEESLGVELKSIKLLTKILPIIEHYTCTIFRVSIDYYSRYNKKQVEIE